MIANREIPGKLHANTRLDVNVDTDPGAKQTQQEDPNPGPNHHSRSEHRRSTENPEGLNQPIPAAHQFGIIGCREIDPNAFFRPSACGWHR
jgi:hypothetical protein